VAESVKRLLAISWAMPPLLTPRSVQVGRALKSLNLSGWQVDVVAVDVDDLPQSYTIDEDLGSLYGDYYQSVRVGHEGEYQDGNDLLMLRWRKPALEAAIRLLEENCYTALLTFAQPWVDHLVGLELKRITGLPWVAHFSDPWVDNFYYCGVDRSLIQEWSVLEEEVARRADVLIFTNDSAADLVMGKYYRGWRGKTAVIPHAHDSDPGEFEQIVPPKKSPLRLVYTGGLYGHRSPEGFYGALALLNQKKTLAGQLEVLVAGPVDPHFKQMPVDMGLGEVVRFEDMVPYRRSLELLGSANVLLLIDAAMDSSPFLPSKLVDYLTFQRPILGITPQDGVSADLLQRLGCPTAPPDSPEQIAAVLENLLANWQIEDLSKAVVFRDVLAEYSLESIGRKYDLALQKAVHRRLPKRWSDRLLSPPIARFLHRLTMAPIMPRLVRRLKGMINSGEKGA